MYDGDSSSSEVVGKGPCPSEECGSSDAYATFTDGHGHCFSCGLHVQQSSASTKSGQKGKMDKPLVPHGEYRDLTKRGISSATCEKWGYHLAEFNGKAVQVANYRDPDTHQLVAQKVRFANKDFTTRGDFKQAPLYGQWLWRDGGKMIVITEGEIDALTVSQLQNNKWPVVSLQSGAQAAKKSIQNALDWLEKFETVVLMFDDDEPGQKAAKACAPLFTPGKCKVARIPGFKDANEALVAGKGALVIDAMWGAKVHRPDGIVAGADTLALALEVVPNADAPYPWPAVNEFIKGLRKRELVTITAGTGIGKSTVCREIAASLLKSGERVGYVALEESVQRTVTGFVGIELNTPLHLDRGGITDAQITEAWQSMCGDGNLFLYDHFGSVESDNLVNKVRYLTHGCGCEWIVIDHISIAISGLEIVDERKGIDVMMTRLRSLVEETGVGLLLVSHLKRVEGNRGHEDGVQVSLGHLRGSQAIAQLSDMVIALERNQQGDDGDGNIATVRVLKNRRSGRTGIAGYLEYVISTGRLIESSASNPFTDADTKSDF